MVGFIGGEINILGVKKRKRPTAWTLVSLRVHTPIQHVGLAWSRRKEEYFLFLGLGQHFPGTPWDHLDSPSAESLSREQISFDILEKP